MRWRKFLRKIPLAQHDVADFARAHAAVKKHFSYNEHEYFVAVETAFKQWETIQNAGV